MPVTVEKLDNMDLSAEAEAELDSKARIAAQMIGFKSLREFELAAKIAVVNQYFPKPIKTVAPNGKK